MSRPTQYDDEARRSLRQPDRALPESLRRSLLAIPEEARNSSRRDDADASHDLYVHALDQALDRPREPREATGEFTGDLPSDLRPAARGVVEILVDFFRHELRIRPLPGALRQRLGRLPDRRPLPRWVAEPRWAAAACWVLAFLLTFATGDVSARLVDAAGERLSRAPALEVPALEMPAPVSLPGLSGTTDAARAAWAATRDRALRPLAWSESRVRAGLARLEAAGARLADALRDGSALPEDMLIPHPQTPRSDVPAHDADRRPAFEGDRDEHRNPHR